MKIKTSRERTDLFYNSKSKKLKWSSKNTVLALIAILIVVYLLYQFGYSVGETAYKEGL